MLTLLVDHARLRVVERAFAPTALSGACLYEGDSARELADVAPFLYSPPQDAGEMDGDVTVLRAWESLHGTEAAVLVRSASSPRDLRKHFRTLAVAMDETGAFLLFRFYDPRVLRLFLPIADATQRARIFGPVEAFTVDDATGQPREFLRTLASDPLVDGVV